MSGIYVKQNGQLHAAATAPGITGPGGDSAYEVAVAEGFAGTESEWLASLVGPPNSLAEGTVTTGNPGTDASFTITGAAPAQTLNLTLPRGDLGPVGPPNALSKGTVTTSAPGSDADFTITGTSPEQTLSLVLPRGEQGPQGFTRYLVQDGAAYPARPFPTEVPVTFVGTANPDTLGVMVVGDSWINTAADQVVPYVKHYDGAGSPEGVVAAQIGSRYIDVNATAGAVEWTKMSGSGNTGWKVTEGDTGLRVLTSWDAAGVITGTALPANVTPTAGVAGSVRCQRINDAAFYEFRGCTFAGTGVFLISAGFQPPSGRYVPVTVIQAGGGFVTNTTVSTVSVLIGAAGLSTNATNATRPQWECLATWPTTLPGTAA